MNREPRSIFSLRREGPPDQAGIHALRALLKILLRQYGFRCIDAQEEPITYTQVFTELRHDVARRAARNSPHHDKSETSNE
jgi:hypothetical protein